ncbi:hypothetical protein ABID23_000343 [Bartonella silvatica]|uniref:TolA protein n=1 Tax=Bartonella silvatica TaxID=357760 RepID=A0ABV2HFE3_9HYPH
MSKNSYHSMKRGLALSLAVHIFLFSWGAVYFINPIPLPQQLEAIPITLAPLMEGFSSQKGAVDAPVRAIPAVKSTIKPQEKEDARHVGEGTIDSVAPFKPKEKPRLVEATPPPSGKEKIPEKPLLERTEQELSETTTEASFKGPKDAVKPAPDVPIEAPKDEDKPAPDMPIEAPKDEDKLAPDMPIEAQKDAVKPAPDVPIEAPKDAVKPAPDMLIEALKDEDKLAPDMPIEAPKDEDKLAPDMPIEAPKDAVKPAPDVPIEAPKDAVKPAPDMPIEAPKDAVKPAPDMPIEALKDKVKSVPTETTAVHQKTPQIVLPDKFPLPQFKPKPAKQPVSKNKRDDQKKRHQTPDQTIEDILAREESSLLNRVRTQGGGAKRSQTPEALGARKNTDDITKMAQTLVSIAGGCIQQKLKLVALGGDLKNRPVVRLRFYLDHDGMVIGDPTIDPLSGAQSQQDIMIRQVYAAVFSCQPYADLPRDQYDLWGQGFDFNVDPLQETIR